MNNKTFLFALLLVSATASGQKSFQIKGQLTKLKGPLQLKLGYENGSRYVVDSSMLSNGHFTFSGQVMNPASATLYVELPPGAFEKMSVDEIIDGQKQNFFIDGGAITITGDDIRSALIKGGKAQAEYMALRKQTRSLREKMKPLTRQSMEYYRLNDEVAHNALMPKIEAISIEIDSVEERFIYAHPDSWVSFTLVKEKAGSVEARALEPMFNALNERFRNTEAGKKIAAHLLIDKKVGIGQSAIEFTQNDTANIPRSLSSFKGKYVLVDFWASWCAPCRAENPDVMKAYKQFHDKNFEVIGVSLDEKRASWLKAIKTDSLPWIHLSDLKGFNNSVALQYGVQSVPTNFLIDPNGVIIARDLRGSALGEKLRSILEK
jgi:peroxiredoxin